MILDMHTIYTKYMNQASNATKQYNQIQTVILGIKQEFQISNNKKVEAITLFKAQVIKSN